MYNDPCAQVRYAYFRQSTRVARHPLYEAAMVSLLSASLTYLSTFLRMDTTDLLSALYSDCKYETNATVDQLCVESDASNIILFLLVCAGVCVSAQAHTHTHTHTHTYTHTHTHTHTP